MILLTIHVGLVVALCNFGHKVLVKNDSSKSKRVKCTREHLRVDLNHKRKKQNNINCHHRMTERPTGIEGVYMTDFRKKDDKKAEEEKSDGPPSFAEDEGEEVTSKGKGKEEQGDQAEFTLGQPIAEIEQEIQRLQNSIRHLERSNRDLQEALQEGFDEDFDLALRGAYLLCTHTWLRIMN